MKKELLKKKLEEAMDLAEELYIPVDRVLKLMLLVEMDNIKNYQMADLAITGIPQILKSLSPGGLPLKKKPNSVSLKKEEE